MNFSNYEWEEIDTKLWEKTYESEQGHLLYIEDTYLNAHPYNQTELEDWNEERYKVKVRKPLKPREHEEVVEATDEFSVAEAYIEALAMDL